MQKLQIARRDLVLEAAIAKLDKYHLLICDDLAYVTKDQVETSVLFELISARYERRSMLIVTLHVIAIMRRFARAVAAYLRSILLQIIKMACFLRSGARGC